MLLLLMLDSLFFMLPLSFIVLFVISICRYLSAIKKNRKTPGTFSPEEIKKRRTFMIVLSVIMAVLIAVVICIIVVLSKAIAYM